LKGSRVIEGMADNGQRARELDNIVQRVAPRCFVMRNVHGNQGITLLQPRWATSWLRGPMPRGELRGALGGCDGFCRSEVVAGTYRTQPNEPRCPVTAGGLYRVIQPQITGGLRSAAQ